MSSIIPGNASRTDPKWKWCVRLTYNDTVKYPKIPGDLAIEVVLVDDVAKDIEVEVAKRRTDVNIDVFTLPTWRGW